MEDDWEYSILLNSSIKSNFADLTTNHSKKFHKAFHSSLNKLFCNYGSFMKVKCVLHVLLLIIIDYIYCEFVPSIISRISH